MPPPVDSNSLLARHEAGLFEEARGVLANLGTGHRTQGFNRRILPLCQPLVEAIGHRMAYESAVKAKIDPDLIALFVAGAVKYDSSWYVEHMSLRRREQREMEDSAIMATLPRLEEFLEATGAKPYCVAPIVSDDAWDRFIESLPHCGGEAVVELIPGTMSSPAAAGTTTSRL